MLSRSHAKAPSWKREPRLLSDYSLKKRTTTMKNKAYWKVETSRRHADKATFVAMITSDAAGPSYYYGSRARCLAYIDEQRLSLACRGVELVQQGAGQ
jgi:hypothetical protein